MGEVDKLPETKGLPVMPNYRSIVFTLAIATGVAGSAGPAPVSAQDARHQNLQVLPADISRDDLTDTMLQFSRALGLPRRAGEGCLHCHEGSLDVPRAQWDYASDAKPAKRVARRMVSMVRAINAELDGLATRRDDTYSVGCETCHRGRVDPRPIEIRLAEADDAGGVDSVATLYRSLHERYFGSDAYDLRVDVLANDALGRAMAGDFDEATTLAEVNEETHPTDPEARRFTLTLELFEALVTDGPEAVLARWREQRATEPDGIVTYSLLDGVGWTTYRQGQEEAAVRFFQANREAFPDLYFTFESLIEAQHGVGDITRDDIIAAYEDYLEANPGHAMAEQNLTNHRRRR